MENLVVLSQQELTKQLESAVERGVQRALQALGRGAGSASAAEIGVRSVAAMLDVSEKTVRRMEIRGELPKRLGRRWLLADIERFRRDRRLARP